LEGQHQIAAVEIGVAIPISGCPSRVSSDRVLVLSALKDVDEIAATELAIQIGITPPGFLELLDPDCSIVSIQGTIVIQIESRIELPFADFRAECIDVGEIQLAVGVEIARVRGRGKR
jgi:hypothetical protein